MQIARNDRYLENRDTFYANLKSIGYWLYDKLIEINYLIGTLQFMNYIKCV